MIVISGCEFYNPKGLLIKKKGFRHGAFAFNSKGQVFHTAVNGTMCAERTLLMELKKKGLLDEVRGILVIRTRWSSPNKKTAVLETAMSQPCSDCAQMMKPLDIDVMWSVASNEYRKLRSWDLPMNHVRNKKKRARERLDSNDVEESKIDCKRQRIGSVVVAV